MDGAGVLRRADQGLHFAPMNSGKTYASVIRAFDAAAATYDAASQVQEGIARELVLRASRNMSGKPKSILDLGCGAGHVTEQALRHWPEAKITALDAAPAMLAALRTKFPDVKVIQATPPTSPTSAAMT